MAKVARTPREPRAPKANKSQEQLLLEKEEVIVDPLSIISRAATGNLDIQTDEELDNQYNHIPPEDKTSVQIGNPLAEAVKNKGNKINTDVLLQEEEILPVPQIRKVAIKKIPRFNFRMGLEKQPDEPNLMPGVGHIFQVDKKGNEYITGFDQHPEERKRLEKILRVDLGPTSSFWSTMSFRIEDKKHGHILNFDDPAMGAYYEAVYFGLLGSSIIANGFHQYKSGEKPFAEWYIEDKEAEAEMAQAEMTHELEARRVFGEISFAKRRGAAKLLGLIAWGNSDKAMSKELWEYIKKDAAQAKKFLDLITLHETRFNVTVLVTDAIKLNILRKNRTAEYFIGDVILGPSIDSIVNKLVLPQMAEVRSAIETQLNAKQR